MRFFGRNPQEDATEDDDSIHHSLQALKTFFSRIFLWDLPSAAKVTEEEEEKINKECSQFLLQPHSSDNPEIFHKLIVWRAALMKAIIPLGLIVTGFKMYNTNEIFNFYSHYETEYELDFDLLTFIGKSALVSDEILSELTFIAGLCLAIYHRCNLPKSSNIVRWSFLLLLLMKFWPSIIQNDAQYALDEFLREIQANKSEASVYVAQIRFEGILNNFIRLMPFVIAFPRGAIASAMALLALFPTAVTPRILLLYFFPFATLLLFIGTSSMVQLAGDFFLASSLICFHMSDFLIYSSIDAISKSKINELSNGWKAEARFYTKIVGAILFVVWIFEKLVPCLSPGSDNAQCQVLALFNISIVRLVNILFSFLRNLILTKLVFADFIIPTMMMCEPRNLPGLDHIYNSSNHIPTSDSRNHHEDSGGGNEDYRDGSKEGNRDKDSGNKDNRDEDSDSNEDNRDRDSGNKDNRDEESGKKDFELP